MESIRQANKRCYYDAVPRTLFFQSTITLMKTFFTLCFVVSALVLTTGCRVLFPDEDNRPQNSWTTYEQAQSAFDRILPHQTTVTDLRKMGFDPTNSPNMKVLTYLDVIGRFLPNQSITKGDLPPDVRYCLEAKDGCRGFELVIDSNRHKRYGNLPLDILGFKKKTRVTGWSFRALLIVQNDIITYKLASGEPNIDRIEKKTKPLGPFQEMDGLVGRLPGLM
jgi:hypothetical protein